MRMTSGIVAVVRRLSFVTVVVVGALLAVLADPLHAQGAQGRDAVSQPADAPKIMAVIQRLFDGMRAGDSSMVRSVFHPQVRMVTVSRGAEGAQRLSVVTSVDGFVKSVGTPHTPVWDERIWGEKIEIDGALASVWVDYAFYAGDRLTHCGIDHFLLVRDDAGAWTIISLADTRRTDGCTAGSGR